LNKPILNKNPEKRVPLLSRSIFGRDGWPSSKLVCFGTFLRRKGAPLDLSTRNTMKTTCCVALDFWNPDAVFQAQFSG
jgi:hypothetical protein